MEKVLYSIASALVGCIITYSASALRFEGRLDSIERSVMRIENKLFPYDQHKPEGK